MPTIKDVAKQAQVSVATVSRVLNGERNVDPDLSQRVMQTVEALHYRPNRLARSLRTRSARIIALVVPDIQNAFFVMLSRSIEEAGLREDYTLLVCNTDDEPAREARYFRVLSDEAVAGIVVCATDEALSSEPVRRLLDRGMAVVSVDRRLSDAPVDCVLSDNIGGSQAAVSHLLALGHRRIGLIAGPDRFAPGRERQLGYERALAGYGLQPEQELIKITNFKSWEAETATTELFSLPQPPTALLVCSGGAALGSLLALNRLGLRIPSDVSVIVFDDSQWAEAYNPPLTTVAQDTYSLGRIAADLLLRRIRGDKDAAMETRLSTRLIVRNSCAPRVP